MQPAHSVRAGATLWEIAVPSRPLAGVSMAGFRDRSHGAVDLQVIPYPAITIVIDLGDGLVVEGDNGASVRGSMAAGLAPGGVRGRGSDVECLQIRLSPLLSHSVLGISPELGGSVVALEDLWGSDAERTEEQLRAASSWDERFAIAEVALRRRQERRLRVDPEIAFAWGRMVTDKGGVRVEDLATQVGWSRKRLWSRFGSQLGVSPKRAARLIRFDHAAHRLAAGQSAAQVAADGGYGDQSHLHRDVMTFAGVTPKAVAAAPWLAVDDVAWPVSRGRR